MYISPCRNHQTLKRLSSSLMVSKDMHIHFRDNEMAQSQVILLRFFNYMREHNYNYTEGYIETSAEKWNDLMVKGLQLAYKFYLSLQQKNYIEAVRILHMSIDSRIDNVTFWNYNFFWNHIYVILKDWVEDRKMENTFNPEHLANILNTVKAQIKDLHKAEDGLVSSNVPLSYINYLLDAIRKDIADSALIHYLLFDGGHYEDFDKFFPLAHLDAIGSNIECKDISTKEKTVIGFPYDLLKISAAVDDITENGFIEKLQIISATYYPEFGIVMVDSARHHIAAANAINALSDDIHIKANVCELRTALPYLDIQDGCWVDTRIANNKVFKVLDTRYALLLKLTQIKYQIENKTFHWSDDKN